ncbi:MAG: hypothetical protein IPN69_08375 [Acidobacteria bacterium]|nr:hypothetical protein [Acidobacteriota bacterium]
MPTPESHDIVIILDRIKTLKGATNTETSDLQTLREQAEAVHARIGTPSEGEDDHEWLEDLQDILGTMCEYAASLVASSPIKL